MNRLRRLRALFVVAVLWGLLAATVFTLMTVIDSLGTRPEIGPPILPILFGVAWVVATIVGVVMAIGLKVLARGRRLQELSNWRIAIAGAVAGYCLWFGTIGLMGGFNRAEMSMWGLDMLRIGSIVAAITGACTLALTAIARRGKDRDVLQEIDGAGLLPREKRG